MRKRAFALLLPAVLLLICLEISLSFLGPFKRAGKTPDNVLWQADTTIGFVPATNLDTLVYTAEWVNHVKTNEFGLRTNKGTPVPNLPASESILFLGDSQTMAVQVTEESTFVAHIDRELVRRRLPLRAINGGCNGFNSVQGYLFFEKLYDQGFRPKFVVMYVVNNDLDEDVPQLPYGQYKVNGNDYITRSQPIQNRLTDLEKPKRLLVVRSAFGCETLRYLDIYGMRTVFITILTNVGSWVKNTYLRDELDPFAARRWAAATAAVRTFNRLVSSYGGRLIIAVHPDPVEWSDDYYAKLISLVPELSDSIDRMKLQRGYERVAQEDVGVDFIDMLKDFPRISVRDFRFALDPHANESGHRIIAQQLLNGFIQLGVLN